MCTKLDFSTGARIKAQQNGRMRFHVACEEDNFKQVCPIIRTYSKYMYTCMRSWGEGDTAHLRAHAHL